MLSSASHCPECGAPLASGKTGGLCARCLLMGVAGGTKGAGDASPPPPLKDVAAAFPHLEIIELIGRGGMGSVYKVRQPRLNRFAALKLLPESLAADPAFAGRFEREAQLMAKLSHPNIASVFDYGESAGHFYLLMEFIEGVNLRQAMQARRFTSTQALHIVPKICEALQFAHEEGVLHRDIKPENILLDARGRVKLVDFGIAKLAGDLDAPEAGSGSDGGYATQSGAAVGTPSYMAPEQRLAPAAVDHRADIYSLGVVFYELLTGELPGKKFTPPSEKCGADPRVDAIVRQALEEHRERRQSSVAEMQTQVAAAGRRDAAKFSIRRVAQALLAAFAFFCTLPGVWITQIDETVPVAASRLVSVTKTGIGLGEPWLMEYAMLHGVSEGGPLSMRREVTSMQSLWIPSIGFLLAASMLWIIWLFLKVGTRDRIDSVLRTESGELHPPSSLLLCAGACGFSLWISYVVCGIWVFASQVIFHRLVAWLPLPLMGVAVVAVALAILWTTWRIALAAKRAAASLPEAPAPPRRALAWALGVFAALLTGLLIYSIVREMKKDVAQRQQQSQQ